jgi:hypothetical protein
MNPRRRATNCRAAGLTLVECLVYIAALGLFFAVGGLTVAKAWDMHRSLRRTTTDIPRALQLGELWRAEVRASVQPPRIEDDAKGGVFHLVTPDGPVAWRLMEGVLQRRTGPEAPWVDVLPRVAASRMFAHSEPGVTAWRWELELQPGHERSRVKPRFTFTAVAPEGRR